MVLRQTKMMVVLLASILLLVIKAEAGKPVNLKKLFSKELKMEQTDISFQELKLECTEEFKTEQFFAIMLKDEAEGYIVTTRVKGRYDYFDFLIWYESDLTVRLIRVTDYFSDHGGEIAGKNWLSQFIGYSGKTIDYGKEIQAISGATISGKAIVSQVFNLTRELKKCLQK